jgi:hypothetical protein
VNKEVNQYSLVIGAQRSMLTYNVHPEWANKISEWKVYGLRQKAIVNIKQMLISILAYIGKVSSARFNFVL